jgi:hypothetical protein
MSKHQFNPGRMWPIVNIIASLIQKRPELVEVSNREYLKATVQRNIPELTDQEHCANCGASMLEYVYTLDYIDALMLLEMAREVRKHRQAGIPFTEANKIRVQHLTNATYAMKSRTTKMSKLGLIAKLKGENGHQVPGYWVITRRGFDALKGYQVPKTVRIWRGKIEERGADRTSIQEEFAGHSRKVEASLLKGKTPKSDARASFADYDRTQWYEFGDVHEGNLI